MGFYNHKPEIIPLARFIFRLLAGEILVPSFHRPGTEVIWAPEQRAALLDSLWRGYPIGSVMIWESREALDVLPTIGGYSQGRPDGMGRYSYLLDGHQRMSSVVQILAAGLLPQLQAQNITPEVKRQFEPPEWWYFDLSPYVLDVKNIERFVYFEEQRDALHDIDMGRDLLPLHLLWSVRQLNQWLHNKYELNEAQREAAQELSDNLRQYNLSVSTLQTDDLQEATEVFQRINSSNTPIGPFHMAAVLAHSHTFDLQKRVQELRDELLARSAWKEIDSGDILRIFLGISGQNPVYLDMQNAARLLRTNGKKIDLCVEAISCLEKFFCAQGIYGPEINPYHWLFICAAVELGKSKLKEGVWWNEKQQQAFGTWLRITAYSGAFGNRGKSAAYETVSGLLRACLEDQDDELNSLLTEALKNQLVDDSEVGPLKQFDRRTARSRLALLNMAYLQDGGNYTGKAHQALANRDSIFLLLPQATRSQMGNLVITTADTDIGQLRADFKAYLSGKAALSPDLIRIGFSEGERDAKSMFEARARYLWEKEKERIRALGLSVQED